MNVLYIRFIMSMINNFMIYCSYPMLAIITFVTTVFGAKIHVTVSVAASSMQLMNLLKVTSRLMPFFIGKVIEFLVSMKRIQEFMLCDEIDPKVIGTDYKSYDESVQIN